MRKSAMVAITVMTNFGFHAAMERAGIAVATTNVGDRYVLEALRERGWALGGEQSGHVIDMSFAPSGESRASETPPSSSTTMNLPSAYTNESGPRCS